MSTAAQGVASTQQHSRHRTEVTPTLAESSQRGDLGGRRNRVGVEGGGPHRPWKGGQVRIWPLGWIIAPILGPAGPDPGCLDLYQQFHWYRFEQPRRACWGLPPGQRENIPLSSDMPQLPPSLPAGLLQPRSGLGSCVFSRGWATRGGFPFSSGAQYLVCHCCLSECLGSLGKQPKLPTAMLRRVVILRERRRLPSKFLLLKCLCVAVALSITWDSFL